MTKMLPPIIIGIGMLALGIMVELFTDEIRGWVIKIVGEKRGLFDLNSIQTTLSMRFGGAMAILMGLFSLWAVWRNH